MTSDNQDISSLTISGVEKISFVENKPYSDLVSGFVTTETTTGESESTETVNEIKETDPLENFVASFSLVEAGTSFVVCKDKISDINNSIEYLGNGEYRVYINQKIKQGLVRNSSPGYFVTERTPFNKIDKRGIKIGYNSNTEYQNIDFISNERVKIKAVHCWFTENNLLNIICDQKHGLKVNSIVELFNSNINGEYKIINSTENIFTIELTESDLINTQITLPEFFIYTGTKIYCNVDTLSVGDKVVFDYSSGKGNAFIINSIQKDSNGVFFHIDGNIKNTSKKFIVSHSVNTDSEIEFGYETNLIYYDVAKVSPKTNNLWLVYKPDITPTGRKNQKVSYIQFYSSSIFKYGI